MIIQWKWEIYSRDSIWESAWRTMDGGSWHCIGGSDQDHAQEKEMQKGKMVFLGGLINSWEKKKNVKGKGEKERYTYLNAECQRVARRDKKAFSDQCIEIEEHNRMGKTRDLFKKIRDTKGTFHAEMGTLKTEMVLTWQKQKTLRRGGKNTQKNCTKKIFKNQITMMVWSLT